MTLFLSRHYADPFYKKCAEPYSDRSADYFSRSGVIAVREKPDNLTPDNIEVMV